MTCSILLFSVLEQLAIKVCSFYALNLTKNIIQSVREVTVPLEYVKNNHKLAYKWNLITSIARALNSKNISVFTVIFKTHSNAPPSSIRHLFE